MGVPGVAECGSSGFQVMVPAETVGTIELICFLVQYTSW